ncbi:MAG: helix-turn-helix domain-containing protein [Ruminococcus sp.]|jgi:two-component system response regulator YesN
MMLSLGLCDRENYATVNSKRVAACIRYMKAHIDRPVTLEELAKEVHLSPYYLNRIFKRYTDASPGEFMLNLRLSRAKQLLVTTTHPIYIISEMCGYRDPDYFIRIFKKKIGATPLRYRRVRANLLIKEH